MSNSFLDIELKLNVACEDDGCFFDVDPDKFHRLRRRQTRPARLQKRSEKE